MTPEAFIAVASGLAMVKAKGLFGAVRLAVHGRTFATVGWPEAGQVLLKLNPGDQKAFIYESRAVAPEIGARGRGGLTIVRLSGVGDALAQRLILAAWRNAQASSAESAKAG